MKRHYSPNHPAVRSARQEPQGLTILERTSAVRARRGIPDHQGRTGDRAVIAISTFVLGVGLTERYPLLGFAMISITYAAAWPWIRETVMWVFQWRR